MWEREDAPLDRGSGGGGGGGGGGGTDPPSPPAPTIDEDPQLPAAAGGAGREPRVMERQGSNKPTLPPLDGSFYGFDQADEARIKHFMKARPNK